MGGDEFEEVIMEWLVEELKKEEGGEVSSEGMGMEGLKEGGEKGKIELCCCSCSEMKLG